MKGRQQMNARKSVNAVSLCVTLLFLFLAVQFSDGGGGLFAKKINKITENLDRAVSLLSQDVDYSNYTDNATYLSSTEFKQAGMAGLYNLSNLFIDVFVPDNIIMKDLLLISNNGAQINTEVSPHEVLKYYSKLVAIVAFLVLCILLFPLCGLCFCCCRCCGNCGASPMPSDKKKDTCKKIIEASVLIMCGTGLLFCIVCAFGSNQHLQNGIDSFPGNMNDSVQDIKTFMDSTNGQAHHLLVKNYEEFTESFRKVMANGTDIAMEQLMHYSKAISVSEIYKFARKLDGINVTLHSLKDNTNRLRVYASQLNDALRKVRWDLQTALNECDTPACSDLKRKIVTLQTNIDFNKVPDVSETITSFNKNIRIVDINNAAKKAYNELHKISDNINGTIKLGLDAANEQINKTATTITENLKSVSDTIDQTKTQIDKNASPALEQARDYIDKYAKYRYYFGIGISCVLLLVTVCITFGLICGICGKRPDGYNDNCCNKGAGGQFLICAVWIMFMFGFVISIFTVVSLLVGVVTEKAICDPLRNPDPEKYTVIKLLDDFNLNLGVDVKPSAVLRNCYQNRSLYRVLNLKSKFDLDEIRTKFNISEQLKKLDMSDQVIPKGFKIVDNQTLETLKTLTKFEPNIDVDKYKDELGRNLTNYSLTELAKSLTDIINQPDVQGKDPRLMAQLELSRLHLNTYEAKIVKPMKQLAEDLVKNATMLNDDFNLNENSTSSFGDDVQSLIDEILAAEETLNHNGTQALNATSIAFKEIISNLTEGYVDRVVENIEVKIGQCGPLNLVIHASITSTCEKVLLPWNGFWFSLFWTIILYIITIFISIKLANLYRKHKPYDQYVETRGGKRNKKNKKSKRYDERNVPREAGRTYAAGSHPPDGRYADMAPKHWEDFPNGGPPHYQRAPTEYERPPPYYYPGNGGEQ